VGPYALAARRRSHLIYFRFANHPSLLPESVEAEICEVYPAAASKASCAKSISSSSAPAGARSTF